MIKLGVSGTLDLIEVTTESAIKCTPIKKNWSVFVKRDKSQEGGETNQDTGEENPNKRVSRAMISSFKV